MGPIYLFGLASRQAEWLSVRQATLAGNIANANTPGYKARDVEPFAEVLNETQLAMAANSKGHISPAGLGAAQAAADDAESWRTTHSGNSVVLEEELIKAGEVNRSFALNTSIMKSFHRMLMMSVKG